MTTCNTCGYPPRHGPECDNPACVANPCVSDAQKARWQAEAARRAADEAERRRIRDIRRRMAR